MLPTWVLKRDGRQEPFEADKISQALFAATETLGAPNAFLARELTDGALHFLAQEGSETPLATEQIAELVEKVVRELGQPGVAQAFAARQQVAAAPKRRSDRVEASMTFTAPLEATPDAVLQTCLETYTLRAVFGRDVAAAHEEGLVRLRGLNTPRALASVVISGIAASDEPGWQFGYRCVAQADADGLVVDAAERYVDRHGAEWLLAFDQALASLGRNAILNANVAEPPRWALPPTHGPLFAGASPADSGSGRTLWDLFHRLDSPRLRLDWHLQASDFDGEQRSLLLDILASGAERCCFVMDRPRQPVSLAEGVERDRSGVLLEAGLDLPSFLGRPELSGDANRFLAKLPSLARMAVRAGVQKRKYLRQHAGALAHGFMLDRAAVAVTPLGLDSVVRALLQQSGAASPRSLEFGQAIVGKLLEHLRTDGRTAHLDVVLDSPCRLTPVADGLTWEDSEAAPADQLRAAATLHRLAGRGTAVIRTPAVLTVEERLSLLEQAWREGALRVRFGTGDGN